MSLKQLFLAVVAVGLFAMLAFYLMELDTIGDENQPGNTVVVDRIETSSPEQPASDEPITNTTVPTTPLSTGPAPSEEDEVFRTVLPEADSDSVNETLSELDSLFDDEYDDSNLDAAFTGNLDEAI